MDLEIEPHSVELPEGDSDRRDVSRTMGAVARMLQTYHEDVEKTLTAIAGAAVDTVPCAVSAGVSLLVKRKRLQSRWATAEVPARAVQAQSEVGDGPCLEAIRTRNPVVVGDLRSDPRWPAFSARMAREPVTSMLSVPLLLSDHGLGSLSVFSPEREVFGPAAVDAALTLAAHAAVAVAGALKEEGLRLAVDHRDLIGQAKGILMERYKLTADEAFSLLVRSSQARNIKLVDIAGQVARTGVIEFS